MVRTPDVSSLREQDRGEVPGAKGNVTEHLPVGLECEFAVQVDGFGEGGRGVTKRELRLSLGPAT